MKKIYDVCHLFLTDGERCSILITREHLKMRVRQELLENKIDYDAEWWDMLFKDLDSVCDKLGNNQLERAYIEV